MLDELKELKEFYDPDTVQLMNWIKWVQLDSHYIDFEHPSSGQRSDAFS